MSYEDLYNYFMCLCEASRMPMPTAEREQLRRERTAIATLLAFWG
jgi:hypothetical protein